MNPPERTVRHLSMIRGFHVADFFTLGNAACGTLSVFFAMMFVGSRELSHFAAAAALIPAAFLFDVLDGHVARWRHEQSPFGRELDSLADVVSFGVGPAALGFAAGLTGGWDLVALTYFVCCGVSRLARFNITAESLSAGSNKVAFFEGTPIPTSVVLVGLLALAAWRGRVGADGLYAGALVLGPARLHWFSLLYVLSGSLMISKTIRIPKP